MRNAAKAEVWNATSRSRKSHVPPFKSQTPPADTQHLAPHKQTNRPTHAVISPEPTAGTSAGAGAPSSPSPSVSCSVVVV
jgi:hypothetical protein